MEPPNPCAHTKHQDSTPTAFSSYSSDAFESPSTAAASVYGPVTSGSPPGYSARPSARIKQCMPMYLHSLTLRPLQYSTARNPCRHECAYHGHNMHVTQVSLSQGQRMEGSFINKSLLTLGTVIHKLADARGSGRAVHIPFRDSKLTRLLQVCLRSCMVPGCCCWHGLVAAAGFPCSLGMVAVGVPGCCPSLGHPRLRRI